jgi:hypothetical protein
VDFIIFEGWGVEGRAAAKIKPDGRKLTGRFRFVNLSLASCPGNACASDGLPEVVRQVITAED